MAVEMPLSQSEYDALKYLMAAFTSTKRAAERLEKRMRTVPGAWEDISLCADKLLEVFEALLPTIPNKKLRMIQSELDRIELYIRMKGAAPYDIDRYDHMILPRKTVDTLTKAAYEQNCTLCDLKGDRMKRCPVRRTLAETLPYELPKTDGLSCPFQVYSLEEITHED